MPTFFKKSHLRVDSVVFLFEKISYFCKLNKIIIKVDIIPEKIKELIK